MSALGGAQIAAKLNFPLQDARDPFVTVPAERWREVLRFAKSEPGLEFDFLQDLTATDHPKEGVIKVVVHLYSYTHGHLMVLKAEVDRMKPVLDSLVPVWRGAEWLEREVFDLFGVTFVDHPDLRRVLLPPDWVGHPLRKDYSEYGGYRDISNQRDNPLDGYLDLDRRVRERLAELTSKGTP